MCCSERLDHVTVGNPTTSAAVAELGSVDDCTYGRCVLIESFVSGSVCPGSGSVFGYQILAAVLFYWRRRYVSRYRSFYDGRLLVSLLSWRRHRMVALLGWLACFLWLALLLLPVL